MMLSFAASIAFTVAFGELVKKGVHACLNTWTGATEQNAERGASEQQQRAVAAREAAVAAREGAVAAREAAVAVREEAAALAVREAAAQRPKRIRTAAAPIPAAKECGSAHRGVEPPHNPPCLHDAAIPAAKEAASAHRGEEPLHDPPCLQGAAPISPALAAAREEQGVLDVLNPAAMAACDQTAPFRPTGAEWCKAHVAPPCSGTVARAPPPRASCAAGSTASLKRMAFRHAARQASSA
jgi:hypothetical protein